jgi:hypothetical protein
MRRGLPKTCAPIESPKNRRSDSATAVIKGGLRNGNEVDRPVIKRRVDAAESESLGVGAHFVLLFGVARIVFGHPRGAP